MPVFGQRNQPRPSERKGYIEIDHALPFSRTWDDSFNNKVLVLGSENQNKGNQTPYEYFNGKDNSREWQEFKARVETSRFLAVKTTDSAAKFDEDGIYRIGVKTALSFPKYQIDELGKEIRPCRLKKRPPVR